MIDLAKSFKLLRCVSAFTVSVVRNMMTESRWKMVKKCRPPAKVRKAGKTLSTSKSKTKKSAAGKTLNDHKKRSH